ncbi:MULTISPECIES: ABC transporter ATP-binding protein [Micrococcales]|uniref:ABC-type multidrug transport system, ATPase component n=3 Tax=Micrococcales TaxID=85006 RepID=C7NF86_KYTSD|nr:MULTISPECIES: ABC transporter ATP-binding protein [Micrococcales]ACV07339.1 ABC-type multidrug transport system, ATPase component [Kytococcus sedentarius DSM 20547]MBP2407834.1 ABC-2 type transport system ATP-binding protein [Brachybacterium fresconis]MCT1558632.1 ABC transporter ATP-binding protein [Helcobacillus massiliensis]MCT2037082.1 ABC transporter ATP-binding protein [Helcobacillus massiliensis]MCT2330835.1 ABC transporter ATP-binding protein [Helcobacillus massiliensis]
MTSVITTRGLTKQFKTHTAVNSLDLDVPQGHVYGFLGPNGSGKSTTMKMLLGLTQPTSGDIDVLGEPLTRASRTKLLPSIGSMIEAPPGYGHLTGRENMRIVQDMLDLSTAQIDHALATVRLTEQQHKLVRNYSLGMKQRLGIAMALARDPALLILDEPTNGLDPAGIEEIRMLLVDLAGRGITVMVSSHLLDEIDKMASVLGILSSGTMIFQGSRDQLFEQSVPDLIIETSDPQAALAQGITATRVPEGIRMSGIDKDETAKVVYQLAVAGVPIYEVHRVAQSLEDVFMDLTGRGGLL